MFFRRVETAKGHVALMESSGTGMPVVMIHGNSSCKEVFHRQFEAQFAKTYRLVAIDLLGHGHSDNAREPNKAYTVPGHAATVIEVLHGLKIDRAAILGWSLGGHIAIEMVGQGYDAAGLMIIGTPPISRGLLGMVRGFQTKYELFLATKRVLRPYEIERFADICLGPENAPRFYDMIARTDPRARPILSRGMMRGLGVDQRSLVEHTAVPVLMLNGSLEPFARLDYVAGLAYENLWGGVCYVLDGAGHAPFIEVPQIFNFIFRRFLDDISKQSSAAARPSSHRIA